MEWAENVLSEIQVGIDEIVKIEIIEFLRGRWFKIQYWKGDNFNEKKLNSEIEVIS
ncbi:unnamed protein product [Meloidogyne enterolobii]|uniref:Uncharacterized protein n=1 Tax=Meloidogyne enterolobii TaxID=390850 RepID=A0ACB0YGG0_MELEN